MRFGKSNLKIAIGLTAVAVICLAGGVVFETSRPVPFFNGVKATFRPSDVWIVDREGVPLESVRASPDRRSLTWVELDEVSPAFIDLLVQAEDRRFYSHHGVDLRSAARAARDLARGKKGGGGSTLPMQLAKILNPVELRDTSRPSTKFAQMVQAWRLDARWSKDQILEAYLNLAPFRGELRGLRAASLGYFEKNPIALGREEAALLVVLLRAPNANPEKIAERACRLVRDVDCASLTDLSRRTFARPYRLSRTRDLVPVFSERVLGPDRKDPSVLKTTLEARIQRLAIETLREQLASLGSQNVHDGAVLVLESATGDPVAYVANGGPGHSSFEQIDGIQSRRQAGSTLKPFVYATAIERNLLQPGSLLDDSKADLTVAPGKVYHPRNYDNRFHGLVTVAEALGSSLNVPAVRALGITGENSVIANLRSLGFEKLRDEDYYGPSLALGTVDVTLWELAQGFRQFATSNPVFADSTRRKIFDVLSNPENRRLTFGLQSILTLPFPAAVKTGTSKDMRDNWCVGWTSRYTVAVWIGNFDGQPMWNVSGISGAAPIWRSLMIALHPDPPGAPAKTYVPAEPLPSRSLTKIRYPAPDMMVGLDPDIPARLQKLPVEIESPRQGHRVFVNGRLLGASSENLFWPVRRGKQRVELRDEKGKTLDRVDFIVR